MAEEKLNATASEIEKIVRSRGIPTRDEVQTLITQLDDLAGKIAAITIQEQENHPDQGAS